MARFTWISSSDMKPTTSRLPFDPQEFVTSTRELTLEATACYLLLICHQWINKCLPREFYKLAEICRLNDKDFSLVWDQIGDKFDRDEDGSYHNAKIRYIINERDMICAKRRVAGRKGGKSTRISGCKRQRKRKRKRTKKKSSKHPRRK